MASPFSLFRKNQRVLMAVFGILAMVAFVFFDSTGWDGGSSGPATAEEVVAATKYFDLTGADLDRAAANRMIAVQFLTQARFLALSAQMQLFMRQQLQGMGEEFIRQRMEQQSDMIRAQASIDIQREFGDDGDRSLVQTLILAEQARRLGIQISDQRIVGFVAEFVENQVDGKTLGDIVGRLRGVDGKGVSQKVLNNALRTELLATEMRRYFMGYPAQMNTPIDRWDYFLRKQCRASAEVLPVRVADFVKNVPEPTDADVTAFFEKYKFDEPVPGSPEPGFKEPTKAAFQYFAAAEAKFFHPERITAEQVAAHYETNKGRYRYTTEDFSAATSEKPAATPTSTGDAPKPATPQATATATPSATSSGTKPADDKKSAGACESDESASAGEEGPADNADCQAPSTDAKPSAAPQPSTTAAASTPSATATPSAAALKPTGTPTATAVPTSTVATTAKPTASATGTAAAAPAAAPPPPLPSEDVMLPADIRTGRDPEFDPLWKVEAKIRSELARNAAREEIERIFKELQEKLTNAALARTDLTSDAPVYTAEQWTDLAKSYPGLAAEETKLLADYEAQTMAEEPGIFRSTIGGRPFPLASYSTSGTYAPVESIEIPQARDTTPLGERPTETVRYLFWKTKHVEAKVPELTAVRKQVVETWKIQKARDLARAEAETLAKKARESNRTLAETFPDRGVEATNPFKWYEADLSGNVGREAPTRISKVDGVEDPGPDFMQTVFGLGVNQVGTAMNNPQTVCYVVRLTSLSPSPSVLHELFAVDNFDNYREFGQRDAVRLGGEVSDAILADAELRWLREPRASRTQ